MLYPRWYLKKYVLFNKYISVMVSDLSPLTASLAAVDYPTKILTLLNIFKLKRNYFGLFKAK